MAVTQMIDSVAGGISLASMIATWRKRRWPETSIAKSC